VGTPRSRAKTLGGAAATVARGLGVEWWPWQRYVADTSMELRRRRLSVQQLDAPRVRFVSGQVGVEVPRQCGKSIVARVRGWTQCLLPELDGVEELCGGAVGAQHVGWLCQDRANAIRSWLDAVDMLMQSEYRSAVRRVRTQRGDESVAFKNGSYLRVVTPSRTGPRGLDLDLILLDEALAHEVALLAALAPTQAARDQNPRSIGSQLLALSSEGDERSTLLATLAEVGRRAVAEGDRTRMWFEWSADPEADPYDPRTWALAIPTLDRPGGISTEFIRMQSETMDVDDFRREYLCLHTPRPAAQVIDPDRWELSPRGAPSGAIVFAVDITPSGSSASLVAVGSADRGYAVELVDSAPGVEWLTSATIEKAKRWGAPVVLDGNGPAAWLAPALVQAEVEVIRVRAGDALAAASRFAVLVDEGCITHQHDARFDVAISSAVRRRSGDRWGFDRNTGDVSCLVAAALGVWAIETTQVLQSQVW
jgi:hypothetical protein